MAAFEMMRKAHYKQLEEEGLIVDAEFSDNKEPVEPVRSNDHN
jgi:hypothetical protein